MSLSPKARRLSGIRDEGVIDIETLLISAKRNKDRKNRNSINPEHSFPTTLETETDSNLEEKFDDINNQYD